MCFGRGRGICSPVGPGPTRHFDPIFVKKVPDRPGLNLGRQVEKRPNLESPNEVKALRCGRRTPVDPCGVVRRSKRVATSPFYCRECLIGADVEMKHQSTREGRQVRFLTPSETRGSGQTMQSCEVKRPGSPLSTSPKASGTMRSGTLVEVIWKLAATQTRLQ